MLLSPVKITGFIIIDNLYITIVCKCHKFLKFQVELRS